MTGVWGEASTKLARRFRNGALWVYPRIERTACGDTKMRIARWSLAAATVACTVSLGFSAPADPKDRDITVANLNLLHGFACDPAVPETGDQCRVAERVDLLVEHLVASGCPDVVTLQENVTEEFIQVDAGVLVGPLDDTVELIEDRLPDLAAACGFTYELVFDPEGATVPPPPPALNGGRGVDEEVILSRYPVLHAEVRVLYSPLFPFFSRHVLWTRIDHGFEPIDVYTTHLASGSDLGSVFCGVPALPGPPDTPESPPCPAECVPGPVGGDTVRECQAKQMASFIEETHDIPGAAIITGDFNARPFSNTYNEFADRGWIDSHLAARNAECDPDSGLECTSGRDEVGGDLEDPALNTGSRIDYIFVVKPDDDESKCKGGFDKLEDEDRDGSVTGLFAAEPNPFAPECGAPPLPICWTSDHSGNQLDLNCKGGKI